MEEPSAESSSFFEAFNKILFVNIPEGQSPVLFKYKTPEKKIAETLKQKKTQKHKQVQDLEKKKKNYMVATDFVREKSLKKIALKGVIKIFNEVNSAQTTQKHKKTSEGQRKQSERFKRRIKRITESTETRKMINYAVEKPKWEVLRDNYLKLDN